MACLLIRTQIHQRSRKLEAGRQLRVETKVGDQKLPKRGWGMAEAELGYGLVIFWAWLSCTVLAGLAHSRGPGMVGAWLSHGWGTVGVWTFLPFELQSIPLHS